MRLLVPNTSAFSCHYIYGVMALICVSVSHSFAQQAVKPSQQTSRIAQQSNRTAQQAAKPVQPVQPVQPSVEPPAGSVGGMGDVNLYPKRVVIDQRTRVASVGLFNRAAIQGEYDISISDMMMTADGRLIDMASVTDPAERAKVKVATPLLRWSPHRVSLGSHDAQTVRIMARIAPNLPSGEYRSHFFAVAVPPINTGGLTVEEAAGAQKPGSIGVTILPRFGISIPVIVRVGETTLNTTLTNPALFTTPEGEKVMSLSITREGTRSAFGDIIITAAGTKTIVGEIKGVGVYPEVTERRIQFQVTPNPKLDPRFYARGARWTITYTDDDFSPGKVLARLDYIVP